MPVTLHIERHFTATETVRNIVLGIGIITRNRGLKNDKSH